MLSVDNILLMDVLNAEYIQYNKIQYLSHDCPHILCLSEHHLNEAELPLIHFTDYLLEAKYCRKTFLKGGVCIVIAKNLKFKL
jgi:hypothetical protein